MSARGDPDEKEGGVITRGMEREYESERRISK
jgi:hypothetical protein